MQCPAVAVLCADACTSGVAAAEEEVRWLRPEQMAAVDFLILARSEVGAALWNCLTATELQDSACKQHQHLLRNLSL